MDGRLAAFLLEECRLNETKELSITHEQIARHLGTAREVVTRLLRHFQGENLVKITRGTVELLDEKEQRLRAPVMGDMSRFIRENVSCRARYRFEKGGNTLFDFISEEAGFEHEWPTA